MTSMSAPTVCNAPQRTSRLRVEASALGRGYTTSCVVMSSAQLIFGSYPAQLGLKVFSKRESAGDYGARCGALRGGQLGRVDPSSCSSYSSQFIGRFIGNITSAEEGSVAPQQQQGSQTSSQRGRLRSKPAGG